VNSRSCLAFLVIPRLRNRADRRHVGWDRKPCIGVLLLQRPRLFQDFRRRRDWVFNLGLQLALKAKKS
jgi:hypothetical protein